MLLASSGQKVRLLTMKNDIIRDYFLKRPLDFVLGLMGLFFSLPLWFLFALAIWLEDAGPIFYKQERVGLNGEIFMNMKFRSMIRDAEKGTGPIQAKEYDHRVTNIGRLLRRTALDELPQLWNIVKGQMSFVGPRPLRPWEIDTETGSCQQMANLQNSQLRSRVRPGLTGVAQVFAFRCISREEKFKYDLWYINNQSFILDIRLILISFWISFRRKWDIGHKGFEKPL